MILDLLNSMAVSFDLPILDWIAENLYCGFLDFLMPIITIFGDAGIFWIACAVILIIFPKQRRAGAAMLLALVMGLVICNMILKPGVGRIRPYDFKELHFNEAIVLLVDAQHDFSFPSGHTIASFEAAVALALNNKKLGIPALILACLIAFSRLYLYVHYPTDVIVSVVLGTLLAILANFLVHKAFDLYAKKKAAK